jgi:hypothetical protein
VIERSGDTVCALHRAHGDEERGFVSGLGLKITWTVFAGLASKLVVMVSSGLASKPAMTVFSSLASKLVATVSPGFFSKPTVGFLVEPQNQGGGGFPGLGPKTGSSGLVIWASKSPRRFLGFVPQNQAGFGLSVAQKNR